MFGLVENENEIVCLTVSMGDKDLLYLSHFYSTLLKLMLGSLPAIEKPDVTAQAQC